MGLTIMVAGLVLFIGMHLVTTRRAQRAALIARIGEGGYKGLYSLVSVVGVILIAWGFARYRAAGYIPVWDPPTWTRHITVALVWPSIIFFYAAYSPGRIKTVLKHPMLVGTKLWAVAHLISNGGGVHAALEPHRVRAGRDRAEALVDHRLREDRRGGRAVTRDVVGLGGDFLGQLGAEVLEGVVELDLTGDGDPVVGDGRSAPLLVEDDVATTGAERHLDRVGQLVDAALQRPPGTLVELEDLGHCSP